MIVIMHMLCIFATSGSLRLEQKAGRLNWNLTPIALEVLWVRSVKRFAKRTTWPKKYALLRRAVAMTV